MRLQGKIAVVVGAGQSPGEGIGNGRATVLRFAREGARVLAVDRDLAAAAETAGASCDEWEGGKGAVGPFLAWCTSRRPDDLTDISHMPSPSERRG